MPARPWQRLIGLAIGLGVFSHPLTGYRLVLAHAAAVICVRQARGAQSAGRVSAAIHAREPRFLRILYRPHPVAESLLYAAQAKNSLTAAQSASRSDHMSILDGVSLGLALGLFIYLLVALLRAERG